MKARLVVFPIKGRNWCFTKSLDPTVSGSESSSPSPTLKNLWKKIVSNRRPLHENAEILVDFVSEKMSGAWIALEKAPVGTTKNRIYNVGLRLLSRVKPSEIFLKSISKEITRVEITYPTSLNPRLVRRRLRHIAMRGSISHRRLFYGSVSLLPFTTVLTVLPLPNIPFFWILFRAYSHWQALKGSERLLLLVSDFSKLQISLDAGDNGKGTARDDSSYKPCNPPGSQWVLQPSIELQKLLRGLDDEDGVRNCAISDICKAFDLDSNEVVKYRTSL